MHRSEESDLILWTLTKRWIEWLAHWNNCATATTGWHTNGIDDDHLDSSDEELSTNGKYTKGSKLISALNIFHPLCQSLFFFQSQDHMNLFVLLIVFLFQRNLNRLEESVHSECVPSISATASLTEDTATYTATFQQKTRDDMDGKLAREFDEHKIKYLKVEHEIKMRIPQVELNMKLRASYDPKEIQ